MAAALAWIIYGQTDGKCEMGTGEEGVWNVVINTQQQCERAWIRLQNIGGDEVMPYLCGLEWVCNTVTIFLFMFRHPPMKSSPLAATQISITQPAGENWHFLACLVKRHYYYCSCLRVGDSNKLVRLHWGLVHDSRHNYSSNCVMHFTLHLCIWQMLLSKVTYITCILLVNKVIYSECNDLATIYSTIVTA